MIQRSLAAAVFAALLAACNGDAPEGSGAAGEVLEGSISDDMLPLEQLRSEAPLADPGAARESAGAAPAGQAAAEPEESDGAQGADDNGADAEPAGDPAPAD